MSKSKPKSKSTVSEAKRAANARNGRLGGPKTASGRARSSMNSLRHGMRAQRAVLLPGESPEEFRGRLDGWAIDLDPRTDVERYQVEKAVIASWRHDRCIRNETATLTDRVLDAAGPDPEVAVARARRLGARLSKDPAAVAHRLRKTSAGCRWMLERWDDLGETLDQAGFWEHSRLHLALNLLGFTAQQWRDEWQVTAVVMAYLSARRGTQTTADDVRFALGGRPEAMSKLEYESEVETMAGLATGNAEGRAGLKEVVAEARADLLARLEWVEAVEARRRATAADRAAFDDSAEGQRRQRYEAMHARELRAALRDLRAAQALRMAEGDILAIPEGDGEGGDGGGPGPDPIAPNEPTAEAPSEPIEDLIIAPSEPIEDLIIAPSEPTEVPVAAPSEPIEDPAIAPTEIIEATDPIAPSEPTEDTGAVAPSEPTEDADPVAPNEPTEAGEVDTKDCSSKSPDESEAPAAVADGAGRSGAVEAEVGRPPAMDFYAKRRAAGGGAVRLPSPFRSGGDGPTSVGLPRVYERSW
jgi:hypothetical protein